MPRTTFERAKQNETIGVGPEDILLTDQVAIVTGGGGGIGQGIALTMARFGAHVAVVDVEPTRASRTAELVEQQGRRALALPTDVMDSDALRAAVEQVAQTLGRIDILVNNAGGVTSRNFLDQSERSWRRHIDINLMSTLTATATAVPHMISGGRGGSIVNITSIEGSRAAPSFAVYAACKAGINNFTQTMALELAEHGIRMNAIAPDHTVTPGNRGNRSGPVDPSVWMEMSDTDQAKLDDIIPLGREGLIEEIGAAAVFLSSRMGAYITGVTLPVDGGTNAALGWLRRPAPHTGWTQTRES